MNQKTFGQNVYRLRAKSGMTQEGFAEAIGVSRTYLQSMEAGKTNPTIKVVGTIKQACRCSWEELLG